MELLDEIKLEEGFRGEPYVCTEGYLTVGFGTKFPLTEEEAELLLKHRLNKMMGDIVNKKPFMLNLNNKRRNAIYQMCYQMGVNGVLNFKKMWKALESYDYELASKEALDSKWATQTPNRANRIADVIKRGV